MLSMCGIKKFNDSGTSVDPSKNPNQPFHHFVMATSPQTQTRPNNQTSLCGKLTTHDPDTYIVLCLHCLNYFRSLTDLLRHRLLNHNILDPIQVGETLPRISKDGSYLVAGGDSEPSQVPSPAPIPPTPQVLPPAMRIPSSSLPTPSPPPQTIHTPQFRSLGLYHQMQNQQYAYNQMPPAQNRPVQGMPVPVPHGPFRPQNSYFTQRVPTQVSPVASPGPQVRPPHTGQSTTFSPAAREFVPSGMMFKMPFGDSGQQSSPPAPSPNASPGSVQGEYAR